jgi:DNA-binding NarL/FixJ family response regulator
LSASDPTRVILADDHVMFAEALQTLLEPTFQLCGVVGDGEALVEAAERLRPDVIVTDIGMPRMDGLEAIRQLRSRKNPAPAVVLTMHGDVFMAAEAFRAGANGFVSKNAATAELICAIRTVHRGNHFVPPPMVRELMLVLDNAKGQPTAPVTLTPRQRQVLQLSAEGHSLKHIAAILKLSRRTVESHKYRLMHTLGVHSTAELILHAAQLGLIIVVQRPHSLQ